MREDQWSTTLQRLRYLVTRSGRYGFVAFPSSLVRSQRWGLLLGPSGGRGGEVRLRLYMTMTMLASGGDHGVDRTPAASWAEALGLPDPNGLGARRVATALKWLDANKFISLTKRPGFPHDVRLLDPSGNGMPYVRPQQTGGYWVRLPLALWSNGWIVTLSARALTATIIIADRMGATRKSCWIDKADRSDLVGISDPTWTRALRELKELRLLDITREPLGARDNFEWTRFRNNYHLQLARFEDEAEPPPSGFDPRRGSNP